jgi:hypothetical protein
MSNFIPLIGIGGPAGSGKDTAASWIANNYGAITVAQADPLKRFAKDVFGFSEEQLWGPSELRNQAVDLEGQTGKIIANFDHHAEDWLEEVLPENDPNETLQNWFNETLSTITEEPISPRKILQTLGTDWGRKVNPSMWINYAIELSMALLEGGLAYSRTEGPVDAETAGPNFVIISDLRFRNEILTIKSLNGVALKINRKTDKKVVETAGVQNHASETELATVPNHFWTNVIDNNGSLESLYYYLQETMYNTFGVATARKAR